MTQPTAFANVQNANETVVLDQLGLQFGKSNPIWGDPFNRNRVSFPQDYVMAGRGNSLEYSYLDDEDAFSTVAAQRRARVAGLGVAHEGDTVKLVRRQIVICYLPAVDD